MVFVLVRALGRAATRNVRSPAQATPQVRTALDFALQHLSTSSKKAEAPSDSSVHETGRVELRKFDTVSQEPTGDEPLCTLQEQITASGNTHEIQIEHKLLSREAEISFAPQNIAVSTSLALISEVRKKNPGLYTAHCGNPDTFNPETAPWSFRIFGTQRFPAGGANHRNTVPADSAPALFTSQEFALLLKNGFLHDGANQTEESRVCADVIFHPDGAYGYSNVGVTRAINNEVGTGKNPQMFFTGVNPRLSLHQGEVKGRGGSPVGLYTMAARASADPTAWTLDALRYITNMGLKILVPDDMAHSMSTTFARMGRKCLLKSEQDAFVHRFPSIKRMIEEATPSPEMILRVATESGADGNPDHFIIEANSKQWPNTDVLFEYTDKDKKKQYCNLSITCPASISSANPSEAHTDIILALTSSEHIRAYFYFNPNTQEVRLATETEIKDFRIHYSNPKSTLKPIQPRGPECGEPVVMGTKRLKRFVSDDDFLFDPDTVLHEYEDFCDLNGNDDLVCVGIGDSPVDAYDKADKARSPVVSAVTYTRELQRTIFLLELETEASLQLRETHPTAKKLHQTEPCDLPECEAYYKALVAAIQDSKNPEHQDTLKLLSSRWDGAMQRVKNSAKLLCEKGLEWPKCLSINDPEKRSRPRLDAK